MAKLTSVETVKIDMCVDGLETAHAKAVELEETLANAVRLKDELTSAMLTISLYQSQNPDKKEFLCRNEDR